MTYLSLVAQTLNVSGLLEQAIRDAGIANHSACVSASAPTEKYPGEHWIASSVLWAREDVLEVGSRPFFFASPEDMILAKLDWWKLG